MDEWNLMVVALGIEEGDTLEIERDDGSRYPVVFLRKKSRYNIETMDENGNKICFGTGLLEAVSGGKGFIVGLASKELRIKR